MVPKGWQTGVIEDIAQVSSGGTPSRKKDSYWVNGTIPWVTTAEVKFNTITDTEQKITEEGLQNSSAKLYPKNTILMAMYGQGKTRGQVAKLGIEASTNQACAALQLKADFDVDYYYQYLTSQYENIRELANSGGQQNLSGGIVKSIQVPIPPLPEQQKIARILTTWDKAISTTERLIENSTQQKKALMQQLLTGKKRLLDDEGQRFEGEWEEYYLNELCNINKGKQRNRSTLSDSGKYPVINGGIDPSGYTDEFNTEPNTTTISEGGNSCGFVNFLNVPFWCGGHCYALINVKANNEYLYHYLKHIEKKIMSLRVGSGLPNIQKKDIEKVRILTPSQQEQQKIAAVLTNADKEIELLKQQLADLQQEKKALMQVLLTGKVRVRVDG